MRFSSFILIVIALSGICVAQDTNFSAGPQYLITGGSTQFLQPIATPTLSLSESAPNTVVTPEGVETEPVPPPAVPQSPVDLTRIYWGEPTAQISSETVSEVEITSPQIPPTLPASITEVGVTAIVDSRSLQERGYGQPLGEVAAFWKANKLHATHVYTNADVARLHGG
jgi:hypothetical protein